MLQNCQLPPEWLQRLEAVGDQGDDVGVQGLQGYEEAGHFWDCQPPVDDFAGEDLRGGGAESGDREAFVSTSTKSRHLHSPTVPPIREQARILLPVPEVPHEIQMDSRNSWIGKLLSVLTFAIAILRQHHPEAQAEVQGSYQDYTQDPPFVQDRTLGWIDRRTSTSDHDGAGRGGGLRLGLSRCSSGVGCPVRPSSGGFQRGGQAHLCKPPLQDPLKDGEGQDFWEMHDDQCIRRHVTPRRGLFRPSHNDVPVPISRFLVHCHSYMDFVDGRSDSMRYRWNTQSDVCPRDVPWTGTTVFQLRQQPSEYRLSHDNRRKIGSVLRQATKLQEAHHILLTQGARTPNSEAAAS